MAKFINCTTDSITIDDRINKNNPVNIDAITSIENDEYMDMGTPIYCIIFNGTSKEIWRYSSKEDRDNQYNDINS